MTVADESGPKPRYFEHSLRVPIANLTPGRIDPTASYIEARIALVWPYSSSTRQYAFLLSETDIRPLKTGRQLKVTLYNGVARTVQAAKVGIGDTIKLSLRGCQWAEAKDETSTPGKRNHWDVSFRNAVTLEVSRGRDEEPELVQYESIEAPTVNGTNHINGISAEVPQPLTETIPLQFRTKSTGLRKSSGSVPQLYRAVHDPFLDEIEQDSGRTRKRTKFARNSASWTLLDDDTDAVHSVLSPCKVGENEKLAKDGPAVQLQQPPSARAIDRPTDTRRDGEMLPRATAIPNNATSQLETDGISQSWPQVVLSEFERPSHEPASSPPASSPQPTPEVIDLVSPAESPRLGRQVAHHDSPSTFERSSSPSEDYAQEGSFQTVSSSSPIQEAVGSASRHERSSSPLEVSPHPWPPHLKDFAPASAQLSGAASRNRQPSLSDQISPLLRPSHHFPLSQSPRPDPIVSDPTQVEQGQAGLQSPEEARTTNIMGPPETPRPVGNASRTHPGTRPLNTSVGAITPRLMPLASPGLPLVSPLVKQPGVTAGYFSQMVDQPSELDRERQTSEADMGPDDINDAAPASAQDSMEIDTELPKNVELLSAQPTVVQKEGKTLTKPEDSLEDPMVHFVEDATVSKLPNTTSDRASDNTAPDPTSALESQTIQAKSKDALAFLEELLQMSPTLETQLSQQKTIESQGTVARNDWASESLPTMEQHALTEDMAHVNDSDLLRPAQSRGPDDEAVAANSLQLQDSTHKMMDGSADSVDVERTESVGVLRGNLDRVTRMAVEGDGHPLPDSQEHIAAYEGSQPPNHDLPGSISSEKASTTRITLLPYETQLPTPVATQLQSQDDLEPPTLVPIAYPQTPKPTQSLADHIETIDSASTRRFDAHGGERAVPATTEEAAPSSLRRASQRLTRKSNVSIRVDSPFFSSTKPEQITSPTPKALEIHLQSSHLEPSKALQQTSSAEDDDKVHRVRAGIRTHFGYYPSLPTLSQYYGQQVDVVAVCSQDSAKAAQAKKGPRDWYTTLKLTDNGATSVTSSISAQIFRAYRTALPTVSKGDVVILRCFKVQTAKHRWMLLSTEESAWAVFKAGSDNKLLPDSVEMTGPHLEYGEEEIAYGQELSQWWATHKQKRTEAGHTKEGVIAQSEENEEVIEDNTDEKVVPAVIPSIEAMGPSSPRRFQSLDESASVEDSTDRLALSGTPDEATTAVKAPIRQQPSRRARTKTPTVVFPPPKKAATPSVAIFETSVPASSPPVSPTQSRRRTRSTLSPNPSIVSNTISITSSVDHPPTSPVLQSPSRASARPNTRSEGRASHKGKSRAVQESSAEKGQQQPVPHAPQQSDQETGQAHPPSPKRRTRSMRRTTSPPLIHELRDGMRYVDQGDAAEGGDEAKKKKHGVVTAERRKGLRSQDVHELRDGVRYVDQ